MAQLPNDENHYDSWVFYRKNEAYLEEMLREKKIE